jgi:hypothetical protein
VVFIVAFLMMFGLQRLLQRITPPQTSGRVPNPQAISV